MLDAALSQSHLIPENVPVFRLEDAGMAIQMAEYATYATLRYYRRFDEYERQARMKVWDMLNPEVREHFTVGIMGMGVMGTAIAKALVPFRFPLRGWSRTRKERDGVTCYYGDDQLTRFLDGLRLLICVLPLTPETAGILNLANFRHLGHGACLINLGRGEHLVDDDLLCAMAEGRIRAAMLGCHIERTTSSGTSVLGTRQYHDHPTHRRTYLLSRNGFANRQYDRRLRAG